jgi:hypothetical protein
MAHDSGNKYHIYIIGLKYPDAAIPAGPQKTQHDDHPTAEQDPLSRDFLATL